VKKNDLFKLLLFSLGLSQTIYSQTLNITDSKGKKQGVWKKVDEKGNTKFEGSFVLITAKKQKHRCITKMVY